MGQNLLSAQGDSCGIFGRQSEGLIVGIGMKRLRASKHGGHSLNGDAGNIVFWLLSSERNTCCLRVKAHPGGARILRPESLYHDSIPDFARGAELGYLFKEIIV